MPSSKKNMEELLERMYSRAELLTEDKSKRDEYIKKCLSLFKDDLPEDVQLWIVDELFRQLSYKRIVEHPDHLLNHSNVKIRFIFSLGIIVLVLMFTGAILFGDSVFIHGLHDFFKGLLYIIGF